MIGTSSKLFKWDPVHESFMYVWEGDRCLHVQDKDEVISNSIIQRFLTIGTLLRRLEEFIKALHRRRVKDGPTVYAFAHTLSTVLLYLRESLVRISASDQPDLLNALWNKYGPYEDIIRALSELYGRDLDVEPKDYPPFEAQPVKLISTIYEYLASHVERQSAPSISGIFAYILDGTSQEYLYEVGVSIGYGGQPRKPPPRVDEDREDYYGIDDEEEEEEEDIFAALTQIQTDFPDFFPKTLLGVLPNAQKSLILLRKAQPDHPLLGQESKDKRVHWLWSELDILEAWDEVEGSHTEELGLDGSKERTPSTSQPVLHQTYKPEIEEEFRIFDMDPGNFQAQSALQVVDRSNAILERFIQRFPARLPSITPTLPHLTSLVFHRLLEHASTLSSTLLSIFLTSSNNLNLQLHLSLLRSYLLVTAPAFKSKLLGALFSDAGEYGVDTTPHSMSLRSIRRRPSSKKAVVKESKQPWAIGLSPDLLEREIWPPVGGDLSFFLRTVIVDALNNGEQMDDEEERKKRHVVIEEAAWRIGFAIRDLPTGHGRDKWLNPLCIEALDFLYMDYKPPRPMDVLISPSILSKYYRIFAFILRLFRVECAIKSVFRMTGVSAQPLFPTLAQPRKLLLHFRFIAQSFVATLSAYVFDTAIGGNFDPFLAQLESSSLAASAHGTSTSAASTTSKVGSSGPHEFSDVFELATAHSDLLDRILTACLLRSSQKLPGELLRQSLELVLEFCVVIGELSRGRLKEYEAGPMIEEVFLKLKAKMATFMKVLKGLVEKGTGISSNLPMEVGTGAQIPTGGIAALSHLLMRLDLGDWWSQSV
ncbi:hypothetical protein EST38_g783 [Candolleomyces aberdarensis]|uniref:Spindle pole body component n=1 Tax=Candolleomyces aberdarensis TaxID=2316362 RepID=A0A4Q2DWH4_9AGAR|nr:hypothetical protein EST38_g783 [Candolleomyces aberdarensis]